MSNSVALNVLCKSKRSSFVLNYKDFFYYQILVLFHLYLVFTKPGTHLSGLAVYLRK
jgi:hypothetical protein